MEPQSASVRNVTSATRYHYMDNLRALAMLTGVVFHAALAYSPIMAEVWLTADKHNSAVVDWVVWFSHMFRMPLFFLIAGFFAHYMVLRRGSWGFLKNRLLRIALPFVIFLPLVLSSIVALSYAAYHQQKIHTPLLEYVVLTLEESVDKSPEEQRVASTAVVAATDQQSAVSPPIPPKAPILELLEKSLDRSSDSNVELTTSHLWFLFNLMLFCVSVALLSLVNFSKVGEWKIFKSPLFFLGVFPLFLVPSLASRMRPTPAPENITPEIWSFGFFGAFFLLGWLFFKNQQWIGHLKRHWKWMLAVIIVGYPVYLLMLPNPILLDVVTATRDGPREVSMVDIGCGVLAAYVDCYTTLLSLLLGYLFLDRANTVLRYIADSSYWIYLIHLPLTFALQFYFYDLNWPVAVELLIISSLVFLIGMMTYATLVRRTPIGWMLNGKR